MKKVLFLMLAAAISMTGFAQKNAQMRKDAKNVYGTAMKRSELRISDGSQAQSTQFTMSQTPVVSSRDLGDFEETEAMITNYDLQSNSALGNRIAVWPDGSASLVATWDHSGQTSYPDRGAGYNYYDGSAFGDEPEERQEDVKSGWPTIAACGDGEVMASHATGVNLYYRPTKGQGAWQLIKNWGNDYGAPTWPRVAVSGPNNEYVHVVMCKQISLPDGTYDNHVYYVRLKFENGEWEIPEELNDFPGVNNDADGDYRNQLSADDYVMAANGDNVAVMFSSYTTEVFYMISHDNGENWERQIIAPFPILGADGEPVHAIDFDDYPEGMTDSISTGDCSHSIAIDNNGVVHATFGLFKWQVADSDSYTYWPIYGFGIVYWNSNYTNPQGGHEIPVYGDFANDANHPEWALNGIGHSLLPERIMELAEADGNEANLRVFGLIDEDGDGYYGSYENVTGATWHYRTYGCATTPGVSVDNFGNVAIVYSVWSEVRINTTTGFSYRSGYVTYRSGNGVWYDDETNLSEDPIHMIDEVYPTTASPIAYDGTFWVYYSADEHQGLYLDINDNYPNSNQGQLTENQIFAIKLVPMAILGVAENEAVNPMTTTRVYPTPTNGVLNVEVNASQSSDVNISVFNIMGQKVSEQNATLNTGINTTTINTESLSSGIYFVTVKANGFENTMKFVVE